MLAVFIVVAVPCFVTYVRFSLSLSDSERILLTKLWWTLLLRAISLSLHPAHTGSLRNMLTMLCLSSFVYGFPCFLLDSTAFSCASHRVPGRTSVVISSLPICCAA